MCPGAERMACSSAQHAAWGLLGPKCHAGLLLSICVAHDGAHSWGPEERAVCHEP